MAFITSLSNSQATSFWVKFFTDGGIPENVAANYAVTFADNRITKNMLLDLNKEILHDMGIVLMGDVISILKHAKAVHAQMTREKVYQDEAVSKLVEVSPARRSTPASRILDHYTKPVTPLRTSVQYSKPVFTSDTAFNKTFSTTTNLKRKLGDDDTPLPKVRRVLPEHEGGYKISMPSGSTPKTRKLLAQTRPQNKTVFERLEQAPKVSSTSGGKNSVLAKRTTKIPTSSSVFSRLGPAGKVQVTSTTDLMDDNSIPTSLKKLPLQYLGILKSAPAPSRVVKKDASAEFVTTAKKANTLTMNPKVGRFKALSPNRRSSEGILSTGVKTNQSVKSRLGNVSTAPAFTPTTKLTIANRLGNALVTTKTGQRTKITFSPGEDCSKSNLVVKTPIRKHKPITFSRVIMAPAAGSQSSTRIITTKTKNTAIKVSTAQNVFKRLGPAVRQI